MDNFWRWQKFRPFGKYIGYVAVTIFVFIGGSFTVSGIFYLLDFWVYGELIGLVSLIAEVDISWELEYADFTTNYQEYQDGNHPRFE